MYTQCIFDMSMPRAMHPILDRFSQAVSYVSHANGSPSRSPLNRPRLRGKKSSLADGRELARLFDGVLVLVARPCSFCLRQAGNRMSGVPLVQTYVPCIGKSKVESAVV